MSKWRARVDRWMVTINKRGAFDVAEYKLQIARKLLSSPTPASSPDVPSINVPFSDLMKGESRAEVCRYFLTALLMSNEHAVQLGTDDEVGTDDGVGTDDDFVQRRRQQVVLADGIGKHLLFFLSSFFSPLFYLHLSFTVVDISIHCWYIYIYYRTSTTAWSYDSTDSYDGRHPVDIQIHRLVDMNFYSYFIKKSSNSQKWRCQCWRRKWRPY